ncbi:MAG: hypothetical protein DELT_01949 [Desulfovibrio sp.]
MQKQEFLERLTNAGKLTPNEKKLARLFERDYHALAFDNLETVSAKANVSKSAVSRFIARLGFASFHVFIRELRDEVAETLDTPLQRHEKRTARGETGQSLFKAHLEEVAMNLRETTEQFREEDYAKALDLLCDTSRPLYLVGSATAEHMMAYFYLLMRYLRGNLTLLDGNAPTLAHRIGVVDEKSVLFAMSFARYPTLTYDVMRYFKSKNAEVLLLTDRLTCPMIAETTLPLVVQADTASMFKTRCSALALLEAFIGGMSERFPEDVSERYAAMREVSQHLNIFMRE